MVVVRSAPPRGPEPLTAASLAATAAPTGKSFSIVQQDREDSFDAPCPYNFSLQNLVALFPFNTFISFKQFYIPSIQNRLLLTMTAKKC